MRDGTHRQTMTRGCHQTEDQAYVTPPIEPVFVLTKRSIEQANPLL